MQYAASTSALAGWSGTVAEREEELDIVKDATMGVVGVEGEAFKDEIARRCVGNAEELGMLELGLTGTSILGGIRARGKELGKESKESAFSILQQIRVHILLKLLNPK